MRPRPSQNITQTACTKWKYLLYVSNVIHYTLGTLVLVGLGLIFLHGLDSRRVLNWSGARRAGTQSTRPNLNMKHCFPKEQ